MDTSWLVDFATLASTGSFSRAAHARNITQPAFSRRIRMLEDWVGVPLFDRASQPVLMTEAGRQFLPSVQDLLASLSEARQIALRAGEREVNTLRFASTRILSLGFFPSWLASLAVNLPFAEVNLASLGTSICEQSVLEGESQFLLCHYRDAMPFWRLSEEFYTSIVLAGDRLVPVSVTTPGGSAFYDLDAGSEQTIPFLAYQESAGLGRIFRTQFDTPAIRPMLNIVAKSHLALLLAMALEGRGIAWVPDSMIKAERAAGLLTYAGGERWVVDMEIRLFRPRTRLNKAAEAFWSLVVEKHGQGS